MSRPYNGILSRRELLGQMLFLFLQRGGEAKFIEDNSLQIRMQV